VDDRAIEGQFTLEFRKNDGMESQSKSVLMRCFVEATRQNGMVLGVLGWPFVFRYRIERSGEVGHDCGGAKDEGGTLKHGMSKRRWRFDNIGRAESCPDFRQRLVCVLSVESFV
jgi:hypothetical protein